MNILQQLTEARRHGLSPSMLHVLLAAIQESPLTQSRIAELTGTTTANVSGACDRLDRDGWIERKQKWSDRRAWQIIPSEMAFATFSHFLVDPTAESS